MSEPHRIRLRGHWEVDGERQVRCFGKPRLSDPDERVWLVVEGLTRPGTIKLNGTSFACEPGTCRQEIRELLADRNTVSLDAGLAFDEVRIEIC